MSEDKLRDRAEKWAAKNCDVNTSALTVFARTELLKAAELVKQSGCCPAAEEAIRELAE